MRLEIHKNAASFVKKRGCKAGLLLLHLYFALIASVLRSYCKYTLHFVDMLFRIIFIY